MIKIFHGDGAATSRKLLYQELDADKLAGREIRFLEGDKITPADLETALGTASLFALESLVIENLLGRLRSKDKDRALELVALYTGDKKIYLWDKKSVTKPNLTKLGKNVKIVESKAPTALFNFIESVFPGNLKTALALLHESALQTEDIIIFTMLTRQISYLIMIKSASNPKFAPWQIGKLKSQASKWDSKKLEGVMVKLLDIDTKIKTGQTKLSYLDHLDLLLSSLL